MGFLGKLGLARREHRAWAMYDWANSGFVTTIVTAIYPVYFAKVVCQDLTAAEATTVFAGGTTIALLVAALLGPLLGAIVDVRPWKKPMLAAGTLLGVLTCFGMAMVGPGDVTAGIVLFGLGNVAVYTALVAYDALLPHIARGAELDRVSLAGYALGYLGGGLLLAVNSVMVVKPALFGLADAAAASRATFASVGVWWLLFTVPVLRGLPEPPVEARAAARGGVLAGALATLSRTLHELRRFRQAWLLLVAFLVYNDGIGTIFRMATTVGSEMGIPRDALIKAILLVQFVGLPATFLYGTIAARVGAKRMVLGGLVIYGLISLLAYFMTTATHFYMLAVAVGLVQGGVQALSRSLFARMIPKARSGEFFGLFGVFEKFAGIAGPAVFTLAVWLSGSSRGALLSVVVFFVVGGLLLSRVDVAAGEAAARSDDGAA